MVKLVDTADLKSAGASFASSSLAGGTKIKRRFIFINYRDLPREIQDDFCGLIWKSHWRWLGDFALRRWIKFSAYNKVVYAININTDQWIKSK